jgi:putative tricarboxylic transport membrane protein
VEEINSLLHGFSVALTPFNLGLMLVGILLGVIIGVLPGLGGANGVAILLPLTFSMPPTSAIIMLSCIYWGALFGGAITSILFNIPGEPWSVATTFDGHPLAQQGKADEALTAAFTSSFVGALFAVILITFLAPVIAKFALEFGPAEFFSVFFLTFASFIGMGRGSPFKVLASMCLGFALGAVGLDKMTGTLRMTFGYGELLNGFDFLIAVIGLFGIGEILSSVESGLKFQGTHAIMRLDAVLATWKKLVRYWVTSIRSCIVGCWMGITPGGATPASFMSYGLAKRFSRSGARFGHGELEGVVAPETAAHAAGTSALLPMLTLGIPGSPTAAVLLGGLMIWGLQPGPMLFVEQKEFVWGLIASMYLGNLAGLVVVLTCVPLFAAILRIPFSVIAPVILVVCAVGAYTVHNSIFDVWMMLVFGVAGYIFNKLGYPLAPLVLAIVLGDKAEEAFRQALLGSQGSFGVFFANGLVSTIMGLGLALLAWPLLTSIRDLMRSRGHAVAHMMAADAGAAAVRPQADQSAGGRLADEASAAARLDTARQENRALKQQLAVAIIDNDQFKPATWEALEAENRELRERLAAYLEENARLRRETS